MNYFPQTPNKRQKKKKKKIDKNLICLVWLKRRSDSACIQSSRCPLSAISCLPQKIMVSTINKVWHDSVLYIRCCCRVLSCWSIANVLFCCTLLNIIAVCTADLWNCLSKKCLSNYSVAFLKVIRGLFTSTSSSVWVRPHFAKKTTICWLWVHKSLCF